VDNWKNITNSQNSVRKKSFEGTFTFSNCHIIGSDTGSLVLIVFGCVNVCRREEDIIYKDTQLHWALVFQLEQTFSRKLLVKKVNLSLFQNKFASLSSFITVFSRQSQGDKKIAVNRPQKVFLLLKKPFSYKQFQQCNGVVFL
jgi:hypothetical protein